MTPAVTNGAIMGLSNAERQRRYVARLKAQAKAGGDNEALKARCAALEKELATAKAHITEMRDEMLGQRFAPKPRKPKTERPPLPPDEERDRIIKGLKTRVRNLTFELQAIRELNTKIAMNRGMMNFQTMSAIAIALHPDRKPSEAEREHACKLFTAWKADSAKARRQ
jgi:hypothetical protein